MDSQNAITYKCPNCDAGLLFDPEHQRFRCEFCGGDFSKEEIDALSSSQKAEEKRKKDEYFGAQVREYHCPNCGADILVDENTVADTCAYCHNPIILTERVSSTVSPSKIIPFAFDAEGAKEKFRQALKGKRFLPKDYFSENAFDSLKGVYYPFYIVDADTYSTLEAKGNIVRTWRAGDHVYTETSRYLLVREGDIHFEDLSLSAISTEDKQMLEGILPFPTDVYLDFSMPYLSGFYAKKRNVEKESLYPEVKEKMKKFGDALLRGTIPARYAGVFVQSSSCDVKKTNWEYALVPVYLISYVRKKTNETFFYAMNGHTGKIYGSLPIDKTKLGLFVGALGALITVLIGVIGGLMT